MSTFGYAALSFMTKKQTVHGQAQTTITDAASLKIAFWGLIAGRSLCAWARYEMRAGRFPAGGDFRPSRSSAGAWHSAQPRSTQCLHGASMSDPSWRSSAL